MFAGCLLIIPIIFTTMSASELFSSRHRESLELFTTKALIPFLGQLGFLMATAGVSALGFWAGLREREVVLPGDGTVQIRWGTRFPLILRRIRKETLATFTVTKEARFAMHPRAGGQYRLSQRPDRWRLMAKRNEQTVNLGSYTTEDEARRAIEAIQS